MQYPSPENVMWTFNTALYWKERVGSLERTCLCLQTSWHRTVSQPSFKCKVVIFLINWHFTIIRNTTWFPQKVETLCKTEKWWCSTKRGVLERLSHSRAMMGRDSPLCKDFTTRAQEHFLKLLLVHTQVVCKWFDSAFNNVPQLL